MKILKVLLIIIVLAVVGVLIAGLIMPKDYEVNRTVAIEADARIVSDHIKSLENMQAWSPWADYDTNMVVSYEGPNGAVGSKSSWSGNEDVGSGSQEVTLITPERIELKLVFVTPFPDSCDVYFDILEKDDVTSVTWGIKGHMAFPMNAMALFMSMDDMMGKDFEKGLSQLKEKAESIQTLSNGHYIETIGMPTTTFLTERKRMNMADMGAFFEASYPKLFKKAEKEEMDMEPFTYGLYYEWDMENNMTDLAAAIAVTEGPDATNENLVTLGGKALKIEYWGGYSGSYSAHMGLDQYMKAMNLTLNEVVVEKYYTNPMTEPDSNKWKTDIIYLVK